MRLDCAIRQGLIVDGTGNPGYVSDVGIRDGLVCAIGDLSSVQAAIEIDAGGEELGADSRVPHPRCVVAPGFIDAHSHSDFTLLAGKAADSMIRQGVTTQVVGQCGFSPAPVYEENRRQVARFLLWPPHSEDAMPWSTYDGWLACAQSAGLTTNILSLVGHNTLRLAVMGEQARTATEDEQKRMMELLDEAISQGAAGLSSGLEYAPGSSAAPSELAALCGVVRRRGGIYTTHIRNRDRFYEKAVDEVIRLARETGVRVQLAHLNLRERTGEARGTWERVVSMLEQARRLEGLEIAADCLPYTWGPGLYLAFLPDSFVEGGLSHALERLRQPETRRHVRSSCDRYWRFVFQGEWDRVMLGSCSSHPEFVGRTFMEIADQWKKDPWDCYFDILCDEGPERAHGLLLQGRLFSEAHVEEMIRHPLYMIGSDAFAQSAEGPLSTLQSSQAAFGWTARVMETYVRERRVLRLEEAIRKMTSFPAQQYRLRNRGVLREGAIADVVVFDPDRIRDAGTVNAPRAYPEGMTHVILNGRLVVDRGVYAGATEGRVLSIEADATRCGRDESMSGGGRGT